ncbi:ArnT family glycosyltransferase [Adhaeribacter soli]|uniref:Uncharacterized protein n=1 Tax=Adhaeribacter soli TaxID=2607655 RepID=A0A5N1J7G4_9BACT|nr:glycosyltransferase family 39 protein [Adhaeribacter soli]KAA9340750.1 hypothetical protein F0P94_04800 [Adhaeribacter soli]
MFLKPVNRKFSTDVLFKPEGLLFFTVAFTLAYFFLAHEGFYFNDDYGYARMAGEVLHGNFQFQDLPSYHRLLIFVPTAFFYKLFGISIFTTTLWTLLCTLGCSFLIYFIFRKEDKQLTCWALVLFGLQFHTLFLSTYLFPDNILMFFALAAAGTLYVARREERNPVWYAALFVLTNFAALLCKETIVWYLPFYLLVAFSDFSRKKHSIFWSVSTGLGAAVLFLYLLTYKIHFGSFLYRFTMVENTNLVMENNFIKDANASLLPRLTYAPVLFLMGAGFFLPLTFCFRFFRKNAFSEMQKLSGESFWLLLTLLVLLLFWFGSTSMNYYNPITLVPRMATPLFAPLAIAAAYQLHRYFQEPKGELWFIIPLMTAAVLLRSSLSVVYVVPALYFTFAWWRRKAGRSNNSAVAFLVLLLAALVLRPLHFILKPSVSGFFEQEKIVKNFLKTAPANSILFTDGWFEKSAAYYFNFEPQQKVRVLNYEDFNGVNSSSEQPVFLLVNAKTITNPDWQFNPPQPRFNLPEAAIYKRFPNRKLVTENGPVKLYQVFPTNR